MWEERPMIWLSDNFIKKEEVDTVLLKLWYKVIGVKFSFNNY